MGQHFALDHLWHRAGCGCERTTHRQAGNLWRVAVLFFACAAVAVGWTACSPETGSGQVRFVLAAEVRQANRVEVMRVSLKEVGVQPAGRAIDAGWLTWQPARREVNLMQLPAGAPTTLGTYSVPAGRYNRVRVVPYEGFVQLHDGHGAPLTLTVEPIAAPFELRPGAEMDVLITLIALPQSEGGYELFTKAATVTP